VSDDVVKKGKKFNAVDLISVVVFAAMFRVLWVVFKMAGVVFPFNHSAMMLFSSFALVICLAVVKKRYAGVFYTIGWVCINFFLQGEIPHYFACIVILPLIPELYIAVRSKAFDKPDDIFHSVKDMMVYSFIYNTIYFAWNFVMIIYVFLIPTPFGLMMAAFGLGVVLMILGSYLGVKTGKKINSLIN
jgi:hypothetical protein